MRNAFAQELTDLASKNEKVVMLSGDIGNQLFDNYKKTAPDRFFNCGVAEQNLISMGAGLAMCGFRPVAYTITPFITTRCFEQIRVDVCYHNQPVTIVGVGSGLSYASLGATHHACEDIAIMRSLPHMIVLSPADQVETKLALRAALNQSSPCYIRIGKKGEPVVHTTEPKFEIGKVIPLVQGNDICLIATGTIMPEVLKAAETLKEKGVSATVVSCHTIKPLDDSFLASAVKKFKLIVTIEEHSMIGGLGGAVSEWCLDQGPLTTKFIRIGTRDEFIHEGGEQDHARAFFGLNAEAISDRILKAL